MALVPDLLVYPSPLGAGRTQLSHCHEQEDDRHPGDRRRRLDVRRASYASECSRWPRRDYVLAARLLKPRWRVVVNTCSNTLGPVIVTITFGIPAAIFAEAALAFWDWDCRRRPTRVLARSSPLVYDYHSALQRLERRDSRRRGRRADARLHVPRRRPRDALDPHPLTRGGAIRHAVRSEAPVRRYSLLTPSRLGSTVVRR